MTPVLGRCHLANATVLYEPIVEELMRHNQNVILQDPQDIAWGKFEKSNWERNHLGPLDLNWEKQWRTWETYLFASQIKNSVRQHSEDDSFGHEWTPPPYPCSWEEVMRVIIFNSKQWQDGPMPSFGLLAAWCL